MRRRTIALVSALVLLLVPACGGSKKPPKDKYAGMSAEQIYQIAERALDNGKYGKSRNILQKVLGRGDTTPELVAKVHLALADAFFRDGGVINLAEALSRYTNFLTFYPNHPRADYAQYQLGLCYLDQTLNPDRDQTQTRKALAELTKVERLYPNSEYVDEAYDKVNQARELLAEHDFRIGYFYFRDHSYEGAIERLREVLEKYPRYSRMDKLYLTLGRSLLALDREDEARLYLQKLVVEYPDSHHATEARYILDSPDLQEGP